jgi:hypothetical protein
MMGWRDILAALIGAIIGGTITVRECTFSLRHKLAKKLLRGNSFLKW